MSERDMPRRAVVSKIAEDHNLTKVEAEKVLRTALKEIAQHLVKRGRFHIAEVGSITVARRKPRKYYNPRTKSETVSSGDFALKIKISKSLKHLARKLEDDS